MGAPAGYAPPVEATLALVIVMVFGALAASLHPHWIPRSIVRRMREVEHVEIGAFPHGALGRVAGELELVEGELTAPLTGRRCAAYEVVVEELRGAGSRRVVQEIKAVPFVVDDGTGRALVHPEHADFAITADVDDEEAGVLVDPTPRQRDFLVRSGHASLAAHNSLTVLRFHEGVLAPGERVAVVGRGVVSIDPSASAEHSGGYRAPAGATMVTLASDSRTPLYVSDHPSLLPEGRAAE